MTIRNLEAAFLPRSIVFAGPNRHDPRVLAHLLGRLAAAGHAGPTALVNLPLPDGLPQGGLATADSLAALAFAPDLVVYLGPPEAAEDLVTAAAIAGARCVLLAAPGYDAYPAAVLSACLKAAQPYRLRVIGPGSIGVAAPQAKLDLLLTRDAPLPGDLALIARSSAVVNGIVSWAKARRLGFSGICALGQRSDVDVGDLIDYFAADYRTRAILLHIESLSTPRKFLSAARAAARGKPVVLMRTGRSRDAFATGKTHAGKVTRRDPVFESALRRAGILRVGDLDEMFEAVETLSRVRAPQCRRMAVIANGRSLATLAADRLTEGGGELAGLAPETLALLEPLGRPGSMPGNPLTLPDGATPEAFSAAIAAILSDPAPDGVLVLAAPHPFVEAEAVAGAIATAARADQRRVGRRKTLIAALIGEDPLPRAALDEAKVPVFASPAEAVRAAQHLIRSAEAQDALMAAPPSLPAEFTPDPVRARQMLRRALESGRTMLDPAETAALMAAYDIPMIETHLVTDPAELPALAAAMLTRHAALVVKVWSADLPFKSDVDGIRLRLTTPEAVEAAARELTGRIAAKFPEARIQGLTLQGMVDTRQRLELFTGIADEPLFGPVMVFGQGGTSVEVAADVAHELPPLDLNLADHLIGRTRVARLFPAHRGQPEKDRAAVALTLVKLSQMSIDLPELRELDINPLAVGAEGVVALDARVVLGEPSRQAGRSGTSRLAIAPYPKEWEQTLRLKDGWSVFVRPVRPEDEELFRAFFEHVSPDDLRLRFFAPVKDFNHKFLSRLTQLDYDRAMALAALDPQSGDLLGVVRLHADPDHRTGEYAVMVRSDLKGRGLGWALMKLIIRYAQVDGIETIKGEVLKENTSMLAMCGALGFAITTSPDDAAIAIVTLAVTQAAAQLEAD
ncbi:GNAT family N-acetyltransferase [Microvirga tunisiensis]|uniref:GNAT family N-acetyltransferase n=1 Tax=Pannonibacter tanglangensis TaxID=2750084 RepID=A0A7X5JA69_9HYPH|nr:GNAT family N-acetyltransferase [Pannonibacter sp. XCT-53]